MDWRKAIFNEPASGVTGDKPVVSGNPTRSDATSGSEVHRTNYLGGDSSTRSRARSATVSSGQLTTVNTSTPDPEFDSELSGALDRSTSRGYHELLGQIELLQDVIPDEGKRMQKALESVGRMMKITPEQIVAAIRDRIDILEQEKSSFENGLSSEISEQVEANNSNLQSLDASISQNDAEQKRLEQQIQNLKLDRDRMVGERTEVQSAIQAINVQADSVRARFKSAYQSRLNSLKSVLNRIQ